MSFVDVDEVPRSLSTDFRIRITPFSIKIFVFSWFWQYRQAKKKLNLGAALLVSSSSNRWHFWALLYRYGSTKKCRINKPYRTWSSRQVIFSDKNTYFFLKKAGWNHFWIHLMSFSIYHLSTVFNHISSHWIKV